MKDYLLEDLNQLRLTMTSVGPELTVSFANATTMVADCLKSGGKLIVCGNGGSAADVEHLAGEIVGRFGFDRPSLPCISLCTPSATFTAIANDYGYENVFKRQVQGFAQPGDVLIGISTSGNSANVVAAFEQAREMGIKTIAMTGSRDSKLTGLADICLRSPSEKTPRIQEIHGIIVHSLCRAVEEILFPEKVPACLPPGKIISAAELDQFALALKAWRSVFTNGCFDVLHPGHVYVLSEARKLGDLLIVGLNSDASIGRLKGPQRPYHRFADRAAVLAALNFVDYVIEFDEDTPARLIEALTPKVLVKGGDYSIETIVGAPHVMKNGGEVKVIPLLEGHSTTGILNNNAQ
jgi:D-sedoheptulose 7-phosphate isomerase